jgi:hypothetical protein
MTGRSLFLMLLAALAAPSARAADEPAPTVLQCMFTGGQTYVYDKGQFVAEKSAPLTFGIAAINTQAQTASLTTERGSGPLRLVLAANATHYLEVVTEGWLHITTVYDKDDAKGIYPAVHSRHSGVLGQPIVTQYQGSCTAKQ